MKKTLVDLFEESVKLYPNNTFLLEKTDKKEGFKPSTYTQIKEQVYRLGAGYQASSGLYAECGPGDPYIQR